MLGLGFLVWGFGERVTAGRYGRTTLNRPRLRVLACKGSPQMESIIHVFKLAKCPRKNTKPRRKTHLAVDTKPSKANPLTATLTPPFLSLPPRVSTSPSLSLPLDHKRVSTTRNVSAHVSDTT
ncbi:hypothetical protein BDN71DRAFT_1447610 [Pleurotus eryngii]|uniref:Uncharacterized protein n=1 Tax=Pleurotus eryngii TaxID=5323 RepID=A0A9P6D768_PLEER|nr:hypothetical protein BDN71DRAFT_1447610 [Pleurotus eryngii]